MLRPVQTAAPSVKPVSLADMKAQTRVDFADDDTLLQSMIDAAVSYLDGHGGILGRALVQQTWRQDFSAFNDVLRLPLGNLIAVSSVQYYDTTNASLYGSFTDEAGPYIGLLTGQSWPSTYSRDDAVQVTWTAGYGANASDVPAAIRHAIILLASHWYQNREAVNEGSFSELPLAVQSLLAPHRQIGF
jgi:uncharacterized phiE125 gp8 family phage protein